MKRIALSLITLVAALAVGSFATLGAWTDTVTITDNVINTGTADLLVGTDGDSNPGPVTFGDGPAVSNMELGDTVALIPGATTEEEYSFSLRNASSAGVNFDLTGTITAATFSNGDPVDLSVLTVVLCEWDATGDVCTPTEYSADLPTWMAGNVVMGTLDSGLNRDYGFYATLDSSAVNDWQGQIVTFEFEVLGSFGTP